MTFYPQRLGEDSIECRDEDGNIFGHDFGDNAVNWKFKHKYADDDEDDDDMAEDDGVNKALAKVLSTTTVNFLKCNDVLKNK
jgi:hypothetical protein